MSMQCMEVSNANQPGNQSRYQKRTWILGGLALFFGLVAISISIAALAKVVEEDNHVNDKAIHESNTGTQKLTADISVITTNLNNIMNENNLIKEKHRIDLLAIRNQTSQLLLDLGNASACCRNNKARIVTMEEQLQSVITQNQVQFATINTVLNQTQNRIVSLENQVESANVASANFKKELMIAVEYGWLTPFNGYQYRLTTTARPYNDSRTECQEYGGDLAVVGMKNLKMRRYIASTLVGNQTVQQDVWIGMNDIAREGQWRWVDGGLVTNSEAHWQPGEPNIAFEDCAKIVNIDEYVTYDADCSISYRGLCERKLGF